MNELEYGRAKQAIVHQQYHGHRIELIGSWDGQTFRVQALVYMKRGSNFWLAYEKTQPIESYEDRIAMYKRAARQAKSWAERAGL